MSEVEKNKLEIYVALNSATNLIKGILGEGDYKGGTYAKDWQVIEAVKKALVTANVSFVPRVIDHTVTERTIKDRVAYHHQVTVECKFVSVVDGSDEVAVWKGEKLTYSDKGIAAAVTNAIKQALLKTFLIPVVSEGEENQLEKPPTSLDELLAQADELATRARAWGINIIEITNRRNRTEVGTVVNRMRKKCQTFESYMARYRELLALAEELGVEYTPVSLYEFVSADDIAAAGQNLKSVLESVTK
jgi:hypothetical protein